MSPDAPAIELHDVVKTYPGDVRALDGVSFEVARGTVFGLLGPNGAGKTTAVRVLATTLAPDSGRGMVMGLDVVRQADQVRRVIGLAGQYAAVDENLTGRENMRLVGKLIHLPRPVWTQRSKDLIEKFGLGDVADRPVRTYSGGLRRRLDLAASLIARPPVLFLDEPTTGLDPRSRQDLWTSIEELVQEGTTVLLTTQYLEEADRLADQIAVVDHGRVIAMGTSDELKANMGATVLEIALTEVADTDRALKALGKIGPKPPVVVEDRIELPVDEGPRQLLDALRALNRRKIVPSRVVLREPSLDDVFLALTGHRAEEPVEETSR